MYARNIWPRSQFGQSAAPDEAWCGIGRGHD
jgi:hypothetical protein